VPGLAQPKPQPVHCMSIYAKCAKRWRCPKQAVTKPRELCPSGERPPGRVPRSS
jgi:hypothetical protein